MGILFKCPQCGKGFKVADEYAGRQARCKDCGATVHIPMPDIPTEDTGHEIEPVKMADTHITTPPVPCSQVSSIPPPAQSTPNVNVAVQVGHAHHPEQYGTADPGVVSTPPHAYADAVEPSNNTGVIAVCILLLATILIPWMVVADQPVWSWQVLEMATTGLSNFVYGEWIIAGIALLLVLILRGMPFTISLISLATVGLLLMLGIPGSSSDSTIWTSIRSIFQAGASALPIEVLAFISVLILYVSASVRLRTGPNVPVNLAAGISGGTCAVLLLLVFFPSCRQMLDQIRESSLRDVLSGPDGILGVGLIAQAFVILAAILELLHVCGVERLKVGYTQAALNLIRVAFGIMLGAIILFVGIETRSFIASLNVAIGLILFLAMPLLFLSGAIRLIGDLVVSAKKTITS